MSIRIIDYYVKNLPFDARQEIFNALEKVNVNAIEKILEKEKGIQGLEASVIRMRILHLI